MAHKKILLPIKGMHCRSCEIVLEDNLGAMGGVSKVRANHKKGEIEIEYKGEEPDQEALDAAVRASGYSVGREGKKSFFSKNADDYMELFAAAAVLFAVYMILKVTGVLDLNLASGAAPSLLGVLVVGLTAGISTCMALVGGLVLGVSSGYAAKHPEATLKQKFKPHVFFNIGRLVSYIVLGGIIGLAGSALRLSSSVLGALIIILGVFMLMLGAKLTGVFPKLEGKGLTLPKGIARFLGLSSGAGEYSHRGAFITGALTFFVPCGFTQAMQLYAVSTGSFVQGALIMGVFALGTLPGIAGIGGLTSAVKGLFARYFFKFAGLVVILLALFNIRGGFNLTGITLASASSSSGTERAKDDLAPIVDGKQIVEMTQSGSGYSPDQFTVKKGIPVVWKIQSTSQYTCASYIVMQAAGISQPLRLGENVIEFTPETAGVMKFTCSMGMYPGSFTVVD